MIQRIQTVYLFFVFCLMAMLVFVPFSSLNSSADGFCRGCTAAAAVGAIVTIFLYKNRKVQIRLCYGMLVSFIFIYVFYYFIFIKQNFLLAELLGHIRYTSIFPLISIILVYLAIRGIKKDDKLVRSLDRLRG